MATIIRQSYIDKIERYLGKGDSHRILRLGTQCVPNLRILLFLPIQDTFLSCRYMIDE